jgi:hypothetical protein
MPAEGHVASIKAPPQAKRSRLKSWRLWGVALLAAILGFASGRMTSGIHHLPEIAATLPGEESEFSRELDERVRERFPVGASDEKLVAYLSAQGFKPEWRQRDYANVASFVWSGVFCTKVVRVIWRADASGALTHVNGSYQTQCVF